MTALILIIKKTGLSNDAINILEQAHETSKHTDTTVNITDLLNELLADRDFYEFMEDMTFHLDQIKELEAMDIMGRSKKYLGGNMLGYSK